MELTTKKKKTKTEQFVFGKIIRFNDVILSSKGRRCVCMESRSALISEQMKTKKGSGIKHNTIKKQATSGMMFNVYRMKIRVLSFVCRINSISIEHWIDSHNIGNK